MISVLENHGDDPVVEELTSFISSLSEDEQIDLVALAWLGRDDNTIEDWPALREEAARAHGEVFGAIKPASTFVEVKGLINREWLVEIEADCVADAD